MTEKKVRSKLSDVLLNNFIMYTPMHSKVYGKVYCPIYELRHPINGHGLDEELEIYNKDGQRMRQFFLRDAHFASDYMVRHRSKYFIWDRYNFALNTHFYSHKAMLQQMGNPDRKYGLLVESEAIKPHDYKIFERHKGLEKDFDYIFTYSDRLLDSLDNAKFFPACANSWYKYDNEKGYENKTKNISILCSRKIMAPLHIFRRAIAEKYEHSELVDTYGTFNGGGFVDISDTLKDYRYTFAIENDKTSYFFTERIISSFRAMCVPIYIGASKISEFFNPDGIIFIKESDLDDMDKIISQCNEKDYLDRLPAIIDNFHRAERYVNVWDSLFEDYLK